MSKLGTMDAPIAATPRRRDVAANDDPASSLYASAIKPLFDRTVGAIMLLIASPLILLAMGLVRLTSPGPAIYSQVRLGRWGRPFTIYKIRSMRQDAESQSGPKWCVPGDPRVTRIGWILRKSHIDELPQLWNVVRGELSLIGPRPERPEIADRIVKDVPGFHGRLAVTPGLTGLAQVQLPPDEDLESVRRKLSLDEAYIENLTFVNDVRILLGTVLFIAGVPGDPLARVLGYPRLVAEPQVRGAARQTEDIRLARESLVCAEA